MATIKAKAAIDAFCPPYRLDLLHRAIKERDDGDIVNLLAYSALAMDVGENSWPRVGRATVEVEIFDEDGIRQGIIDALKTERTNVQAEAHKRITEIDEQIQNLLAISFDGDTHPIGD